MNTPRIPTLCLLFATGFLYAQNPASPAAAQDAAAQTEMQKWLADLDAQWQAAFKRDVIDPHTAEHDKLRGQYVAALEAGVAKASGAGDLNAAIAWRNEQKRFAEANGIPAQDDAADAPAVKQLRAAWRSQLPRIETDRATRAKALLAKYDQVLAQAQAQLTKGNRIDDAILVKAKRDEVAAAWLAGVPVAPPAVAIGLPKPTTIPAKPLVQPVAPKITEPAVIAIPSGEALAVASEIRAWSDTKDVAVGALAFLAPNGSGTRGGRAILIKTDPLTVKNGSTWSFRYTRDKSVDGIQIIHSHGQGQVIIHLRSEGAGISTPRVWADVGYGPGDTKRLKKSKESNTVFPLKDGEEYQVVSKLDGRGGYELNINGKLVATAQVTTASPLSIAKSGFQGQDLPQRWEVGYAALLVASVRDGESNICREVRFLPSVAK